MCCSFWHCSWGWGGGVRVSSCLDSLWQTSFCHFFYLPGWFVAKTESQSEHVGTETMSSNLPLIVGPLWIIGPCPLVRSPREPTKPDVGAVRNRPMILSIIYIVGNIVGNWATILLWYFYNIATILQHCTMCILCSMFTFQPNKLRHILKVASW